MCMPKLMDEEFATGRMITQRKVKTMNPGIWTWNVALIRMKFQIRTVITPWKNMESISEKNINLLTTNG